ncbi:MAG: hypothetical protein ACR2G7_11415 [Acidimicrobiales bacterium]
MRALRLLAVLGVVLVVGLIAGAFAAGRDEPALTAAEAQTFTREALTASGVRPVEVQGEPRRESFVPEEGRPIPVWVVPAKASGQPLELYVAETGDRAVNLDDALSDGGFVLNEQQFKTLENFRLDVAGDRVQRQRQGPAIAAGVLVVLVAVALLLAVVSGRVRSARSDE